MINKLISTKLRQPLLHNEILQRSKLHAAVSKDKQFDIITVIAAAGYGKTTLLSLWREDLAKQG